MKREPAVAGQFYPSSPSELSDLLGKYIREDEKKESAIGVVSPHAGLIYSGEVAGAVYSGIKFPDTFVLIGPNHHGIGSPVSIMSSGVWKMPAGEVEIDLDLSARLKEKSSVLHEDHAAHSVEHSLEVQLPFILYLSQQIRIVPILIGTDSPEVCRMLGETLADLIKETAYDVTIIASSDMSHYVTDSTARSLDRKAIEKIEALDPEGLYNTVRSEGISMCGVMPVATMLYAARQLGAKNSTLIKYMTSGETSGDYDHVVGYAGMIVKRP